MPQQPTPFLQPCLHSHTCMWPLPGSHYNLLPWWWGGDGYAEQKDNRFRIDLYVGRGNKLFFGEHPHSSIFMHTWRWFAQQQPDTIHYRRRRSRRLHHPSVAPRLGSVSAHSHIRDRAYIRPYVYMQVWCGWQAGSQSPLNITTTVGWRRRGLLRR